MTTGLIRHPEGGALTPARVGELIELAIRDGKGPEAVATVKELVAVAKDLAAIQARNDFNAAFAQFKRDCPKILKTKIGGDVSDGGSRLRWNYAPLGEIKTKVDPVLLPLGLSYGWSSEDAGEGVKVTCTLRHVMGHAESASAAIRKSPPNRAQTVGMTDEVALSIGMRRSLSMVLGLVSEDVPVGGAGEDDTPISERQAADLGALLAEIESRIPGTRDRFLRSFKIAAPELLPAFKYAGAVAQLQRKR